MSELRLVGKVKSAQGLKGEIFIIFFSKDYSWAQDIEKIYLENKAYNVVKIALHKDGLKVLLEGLSNRNQSEALIGKEVFIDNDFFDSEDGESIFLSEIENFLVVDESVGNLGRIIGFSSNTIQDLLIIKYNEREIEVPFVNEFVKEIDYHKEIIYMNLPEGLLEIND